MSFFIIFGTLNTRSPWYCKEKVYFEKFSYVSNTILRVENSRNKRFKKASEIYISPFFPTLIISLSSFILIELLKNRSVLIISSVTSPPILVLYTIFSAYATVLCFSDIGWWDFFLHSALIISMSCMVLTFNKILLNISQVNYFEDAKTPFVNNPLWKWPYKNALWPKIGSCSFHYWLMFWDFSQVDHVHGR